MFEMIRINLHLSNEEFDILLVAAQSKNTHMRDYIRSKMISISSDARLKPENAKRKLISIHSKVKQIDKQVTLYINSKTRKVVEEAAESLGFSVEDYSQMLVEYTASKIKQKLDKQKGN